MPSKPPTTRKPPHNLQPLTNISRIASAKQKLASRPPKSTCLTSSKSRTLPPPDEVAEEVDRAERKDRMKELAASKKVARRNGKWEFIRGGGKGGMNAEKISKARRDVRGKGKGKWKGKEDVSEALGLKKKRDEEVGGKKGGRKIEKKQSAFRMVMEQSGEGILASAGVGRTLEEVVVDGNDVEGSVTLDEASEGDD